MTLSCDDIISQAMAYLPDVCTYSSHYFFVQIRPSFKMPTVDFFAPPSLYGKIKPTITVRFYARRNRFTRKLYWQLTDIDY